VGAKPKGEKAPPSLLMHPDKPKKKNQRPRTYLSKDKAKIAVFGG
jgi:hypothetical protein